MKKYLPLVGLILIIMIGSLLFLITVPSVAQTPSVNLITNGKFSNWPNKSYNSNPAHDTEMAENWQWGKGNTASTWDIYKTVDAPEGFDQALKIEVTTLEATPSSTSNPHLRYMFYGYDLAQMEGKTYDLSFWVKSNVEGVQSLVFHNPHSSNLRTIAKDYTIDDSNTWEHETVTVTIEDSTWRTGASEAMKLRFCFGGNSAYMITPNTWQNGNDVCSVNQTRLETVANNYISFAGIEMTETE